MKVFSHSKGRETQGLGNGVIEKSFHYKRLLSTCSDVLVLNYTVALHFMSDQMSDN